MPRIATIYTPRPLSAVSQHVVARSAIIGRSFDGGGVDCYYEGNLRRTPHLTSYATRLAVAAVRMRDEALTIARSYFSGADMIAVGRYDLDRLAVVEITNAAALEVWAGESSDAIAGLRHSSGPIDWDDAEALAAAGRRVGRLSVQAGWMRSQAGQLLRFDFTAKTVTVHDHDEPGLAQAIGPLSEIEQRLLFGDAGQIADVNSHSAPYFICGMRNNRR